MRMNQVKLEIMVSDILKSMGVPAHILGYKYLRHAIVLVVNDGKMMETVTKKLYPSVANQFNSTPTRVERAMRSAIDAAWARKTDAFAENFKYSGGSASNSEFIATIADCIYLKELGAKK